MEHSHPSDDLYSPNEEADDESFAEELSPADGYFERRQMPNETIILPPEPEEPKSKLKSSEVWQETLDNTKYLPTDSRLLARPLPLETSIYSPSSSGQHSHSASMGHPAQDLPSSQLRGSHRPSSNPFYINTDPPPAYTPPSTANSPTTSRTPVQEPISPRSNPRPPSPRNIEEGLPPRREPESMGAPEEQSNERTPLWNNTIRSNRVKDHSRRIFARKILFLALLAVLISGFIKALYHLSQNLNRGNHKIEEPPMSDPPNGGNGHYCPREPYINEEKTFDLPLFPMEDTLKIVQTTYNNHSSSNWIHVSTRGEVRVRRSPPGSRNGNKPYITTSLNISDPGIIVKQLLDEENRALRIETPIYDRVEGTNRPCVSLVITAWVPENFVFSSIEIVSVQLGLRIMDDARVKVRGTAEFATLSGDTWFPQVDQSSPIWKQAEGVSSTAPESEPTDVRQQRDATKYPIDSRHIIVQCVSGSITGGFPLYDSLQLLTTSGDIKATISPEDVLPSAPAPAQLIIKTTSGDITVTNPIYGLTSALYRRDYRTKVQTNSGTVKGSFIFTSEGKFGTTSANLHIDVLPVVLATSDNPYSTPYSSSLFSTDTTSGDIDVNLLEPVILINTAPLDHQPRPTPGDPQDPGRYIPIGDHDPYRELYPPFMPTLRDPKQGTETARVAKSFAYRSLHSLHHTTSATIKLHYPSAFEGFINAQSISGSISVEGEDVTIIKNNKGYVYKEVVARKGEVREGEGSFVELRSISGSLDVQVGN
ncbi:hypothetical protein F5884DRAFT_660254 [Xylogone sp. PMI_703]|nr:hypothetical protein F5884DRAFT_660254 [Xylogone sp. PMI_703]